MRRTSPRLSSTVADNPPAPAAGTLPGDPPLPSYPWLDEQPKASLARQRVTTTPKPCRSNGADESPTRDEVLRRARSWLAVVVPYSQNRCYSNEYGCYRTDCSGFVSMAWGLGGSGQGHWTGNLHEKSHVIARGALQPGDALLRHVGDPHQDHVALFERWADAAHTRPIVIEQTGSHDTVRSTWRPVHASRYTPVRYDHIKSVTPPPPPPPRIGVLTTDGVAMVKEGGLSAKWVTEYKNVQLLALAGDRIGVLTADGVALVKEGGLSAKWVTEYKNVQLLALAGDRIGVLTADGVALVKDGGLSARWVTEYKGVEQLVLAGDRIGVLTADGVAMVKDGGLSARWVTEYEDVEQLALAGDRIGVLTADGVAMVKEGGLSARWVTEYEDVEQLVLAGDRIGVLTTDGVAMVKDGGLSAEWITEYTGVRQLALAGDRIGVLTADGAGLVKEGGLSAAWVKEHSGVRRLVLS